MKYCHIKPGKPPADIDWTVTAEHCSELHPSPDSGSLTISEGECRDVQVSIPIPDDVCARSDATLKNSSDGCDKNHKASGNLCILPTGEHSEFLRWDPVDVAIFKGCVEPSTADFVRREVKEACNTASEVSDGCHFYGSAIQDYSKAMWFLNSTTWTLRNGNSYEDGIGNFAFNLDQYYADHGQTPCTISAVQHMQMKFGNGSWHEYKANPISIDITDEGALVTRDTEPASRRN